MHDTETPTRHHGGGAFGSWLDAAWLDGSSFVTCGRAGAIAIWNADTRKSIAECTGQVGDVSSVAVGAGGRFVATGGSASVALWEGDRMQPVVQVVGLGPVYRVALTADGRFAWCAGDDRLSFVELATGRFGAAPLQGKTGLIKMSYVVALLVALVGLLQIVTSRPIYASAAKDNLGLLRALEKCGFTVTGSARAFANWRGDDIEEVFLELR